jgi:hypothetical protein
MNDTAAALEGLRQCVAFHIRLVGDEKIKARCFHRQRNSVSSDESIKYGMPPALVPGKSLPDNGIGGDFTSPVTAFTKHYAVVLFIDVG